MSTVTRWWWIRHAPTDTEPGRIYGRADLPADVSDGTSVAALATRLPGEALWLTSHLRRTHETAAALAEAVNLDPSPEIEPDLAEQDFGAWQHRRWDDLQAEDPAGQAAFWRDPTGTAPPGGESFAAVIARTAAVIDRRTGEAPGRDIVAVAHGGTIRAAVAVALDLSPARAMALIIDNLSLTRLDHVADGLLRGRAGTWRVVGVNLPANPD